MSRHGAPVTVALLAVLVASFLAAWLGGGMQWLAYTTAEGMGRPWTLFTYPFYSTGAGQGFLLFVILCLWLWGIGGDLERRLGATRYLLIWFGATVVGALAVSLAAAIMSLQMVVLAGTLIPLGAVTVAWGVTNPSAMIQLMFVLPITGKWLAWLTYGIVVFGVGSDTHAPAAGLFAAIPLVLAHFYVLGRLPGISFQGSRTGPAQRIRNAPKQDESYFDDVKRREKERAERERLRKLFEGSIQDDDDR
ncbi:MAG: rhomboid family intramembrane serine protease [Fimbriimonadaceae bacterium]|nr:rhomboid family intramembrane serine protease [Fimbriimonadaceae bacterium]